MSIKEVTPKGAQPQKHGLFGFFKNRKKTASKDALVKIYVIFKLSDKERKNPITFVSTKQQALEAIDLYDYYTHFSHFSSWCRIRHYDIDDEKAWERYAETVLATEAESDDTYGYTMVEYLYSQDNLASIIRMTALCTPLLASYENEEESENYAMATAHMKPSKLDLMISEATDELGQLDDARAKSAESTEEERQ